MSKDIWHEPTETPTEHKTLLFDSIEFDETEMGVYSGGLFHSYNEFEPMTPAGLSRWAYLSDFINCQKELIRTRKALDVAVDALKSAKTRFELINNSKFANLNNVLQIQSQCEILKIEKSLEQIKALEQKDVK